MRTYHEIMRCPVAQITVAEMGLLQLEDAMLDVRKQANRIRLSRALDRSDIRYEEAYFHGVRYTVANLLLVGDYESYHEFERVAEAYASEVRFLSWEYLRDRGAQ
jgi:hypothetical protein